MEPWQTSYLPECLERLLLGICALLGAALTQLAAPPLVAQASKAAARNATRGQRTSHGTYVSWGLDHSLASVLVSSRGNDMSVYMLAATRCILTMAP